ncbi:MAG TPA: histidine kinase [Chitinophagaceae bacterium]|nr:histidine kinase [Chitinophagaceae bacterium]
MKLPRFNSKDNLVMVLVVVPFVVMVNSFIFGKAYFTDWRLLASATAISAVLFCFFFMMCGVIAITLRNRMPDERLTGIRMALCMLIFILMSGLFLLFLFLGYEKINFFGYRFNETRFTYAYISLAIINISLTLVMEGISRFDQWKLAQKETEALKNVYQKSQLLGLKSQVNPHFLFNSLNSLSSLINEDEDKAERFLDEMSKVYRYMLRNEEDQLVELQTELQFIKSYLYLLKARYGEGLQLETDISEEHKGKYIPPLTLQVLVENAFSQNTMSKSNPLKIVISSGENEQLVVSNNLQPKVVTEYADHEKAVDNLISKYRLLNQPAVVIKEESDQRRIYIPLISQKEEVAI